MKVIKGLILISLIIILASCELSTSTEDSFVKEEMKQVSIQEETVLRFSEVKQENNITTYLFKLDNNHNREIPIRLDISNKVISIDNFGHKVTILQINDIEVKYWFTGAVIHFLWQSQEKYFYLNGDIASIGLEKFTKIVDYFINHQEDYKVL